MGNWNITIVGTGCHHNTNRDDSWRDNNDADIQFKNFVDALKASGHTIHHASFVFGGGNTEDGQYLGAPRELTASEIGTAIYRQPQLVKQCLDANDLDKSLENFGKPTVFTPL